MIRNQSGQEVRYHLPMESGSMVEKTSSDPILKLGDSISQLLGNCLAFQRFDCIRMRGCGHDDESHDGDFGFKLLQSVI